MTPTVEDSLNARGTVEISAPSKPATRRLNGRTAPGPRFKLVKFNEVSLAMTASYLIRGIVPREGLVVIWGPPKCGKTFWCLDLMMHIAEGRIYRGHRVKKGPVVYVACEGERGLHARIVAFRKRYCLEDDDDPAFYLVTTRLDLVADHQTLVEDIKAQLPAGLNASAVVIDTLNRSIAGSESSDEDMGGYIKATDAIREAFKCAVLVIHHCGVDDRRPRGHTSLTGAVDAQIAVQRDVAGIVTATVEYLKDGPDGAEGAQITSRLEIVEIGEDEDGEQVTSCVVIEAGNMPTTSLLKLSRNQQTMLAMLNSVKSGGLTVEDWNELARAEGIGLKRKADLYDIRKALKDRDLVYEDEGRWYAKK
jgi:hypothetical protein